MTPAAPRMAPCGPTRVHPALALALLGLLLPQASSCSGKDAAPQVEAADRPGSTLPDPAEAGLVTPEEAAQAAQEAIDPSNAEAELERLRREIEGG